MYSEYISEPRVGQLDENSESYKKMKSDAFYAKFEIDFDNMTSYTKLSGYKTDDECDHYVDLTNNNLYSWNFFKHSWCGEIRKYNPSTKFIDNTKIIINNHFECE